ncbi:MAG: antitoxin Xre-like helix-turn-helix domain-containing protein [Ginsengibacter sp.]
MSTIALNAKNSIGYRFRGFDLSNLNAIVSIAQKGIKPKVFYDFSEAIKMPIKNLASVLNLSARTISNYDQQEKLLDPIYSEHLLKLISLYEKGEQLFGNIDEFNYWLKKPLWNKKSIPFDLIATSGGVDLVTEKLNQLAEGYPL